MVHCAWYNKNSTAYPNEGCPFHARMRDHENNCRAVHLSARHLIGSAAWAQSAYVCMYVCMYAFVCVVCGVWACVCVCV